MLVGIRFVGFYVFLSDFTLCLNFPANKIIAIQLKNQKSAFVKYILN